MAISPAQLRKRGVPYWKQILVGGLYTGLSPIASGTVASAVAALLYFTHWGQSFWVLLGCSLVAFLGGIPLARDTEKALGHDPSFVTLDEFAGQWLAMASPIVLFDPYWALLTFFVFRVFDIAKLWPANYFDRQTGGVGIIADDIVGGLISKIVCQHILFALQFVLSFI
jgi:phosphatidylglycerophosphatase A